MVAPSTNVGSDRPTPNRPVTVVVGAGVSSLSLAATTTDSVGMKAIGLLSLPAAWVPEFFVVSGTAVPDQSAVEAAGLLAQMAPLTPVLVRSSGTMEGMEERGALDSRECSLSEVAATIVVMLQHPTFVLEVQRQSIHFVVQQRMAIREKGHLSNERRLSRHPRDWNSEIEGSPGELAAVGVRKWRDSSSAASGPLSCSSRVVIPRSLRAVASWCGTHRSHLEWVWDGASVWIVQLDYLDPRKGIVPSALVSAVEQPSVDASNLTLFVPSTAAQLLAYPKLSNARLYLSLGYTMPPFYVLSSELAIQPILRDGAILDAVQSDLEQLCSTPFVLRTDAGGLAHDERQMLPRSDELRSGKDAADWLLGPFRNGMEHLSSATLIALLGHHFIPATASAWCLAMPEERRVRIESLWGIPEGVYFFAHDVYDVDTMQLDLAKGTVDGCEILSSRERYKDKFVAPNAAGEWIVHRTAEGPDWSGSIRKEVWAKEIAWTSRRIAVAANSPVVVMWFVDVSKDRSAHRVLPWYHEKWEKTEGTYRKAAAPRKKFRNSQVHEIRSRADWETLLRETEKGTKVERVLLNPDDSAILRSRDWVDELATHALEHGYVVELSGGLLSHLFYLLTKKGCNVECVDLFGTDKEQIEYNKIVRDKIPSDIESRGEQVEVVKLNGDALIEALKRKIIEEAFEVADARTADEIADELADVREVVDALSRALGLSEHEVADRQRRKRERRGGLGQSLMLLRTTLPPIVSAELTVNDQPQLRTMSRVEELPRGDDDFHIDYRVDATGTAERQLTMILPAQVTGYSAGEHRFDLPTSDGARHEMFFNAKLERSGANLRLRVRLTNAAVQLPLPLDD